MTIEEQRQAIRKGIRDILPCPPIAHRYYFADLILAFLTEKGAVLKVSADSVKDKGVHFTAPLMEKK